MIANPILTITVESLRTPVPPGALRLLAAMQKGVEVHWLSGRDSFAFRGDTMRRCGAQIGALVNRGLAQYVRAERSLGGTYQLTDAGRAFDTGSAS